MTYLISPTECHSCFGPLVQKKLFSHTCKMLTSVFLAVERDNRHDIGTCSGTICRTAWRYLLVHLEKRWLLLLCSTRCLWDKERENNGHRTTPVSSLLSAVFIFLGSASLFFQGNRERQCTLALRSFFCSCIAQRWTQPSTSWKCSEGDEQDTSPLNPFHLPWKRL